MIFGCFALGAIVLLRKRKSTTALLILPILLTLAASALRRYPYGMSARVNLYLVPSILILAAAGVSWICCRASPVVASPKLIAALGCSLVLFAACRLGNDLGHPYRTPWDRTGREFARWFWEEMPVDAEVVCVRSDLGIPFRPTRWAYDGADQYLCYQRIYSRRHREGRQPGWDRISERRPLRCVLLSRLPEEVPGFRQWIDEHRDRYALKDVRIYPATRGSIVEPALFYVVCDFVPSTPAVAAGGATKLRHGVRLKLLNLGQSRKCGLAINPKQPCTIMRRTRKTRPGCHWLGQCWKDGSHNDPGRPGIAKSHLAVSGRRVVS